MNGWIISEEDDNLVENLDVLDENTFEYLTKKRIYQKISHVCSSYSFSTWNCIYFLSLRALKTSHCGVFLLPYHHLW